MKHSFSFSPVEWDGRRQSRQLIETLSMLFLIPIILIVEKLRDVFQMAVAVLI